MAEKIRLQDGFEPIWAEDFEVMRGIGPRAFCLRLFMQLSRDHETNLCKISELKIQRQFGWNPRTSRKTLRVLVENGFIVPKGHLTYLIRVFRRLSTDSAQNTESRHAQTRHKIPTDSAQNTESTRHKIPTDSAQNTESLYTESELQNQNKPGFLSSNEILKTVGQTL